MQVSPIYSHQLTRFFQPSGVSSVMETQPHQWFPPRFSPLLRRSQAQAIHQDMHLEDARRHGIHGGRVVSAWSNTQKWRRNDMAWAKMVPLQDSKMGNLPSIGIGKLFINGWDPRIGNLVGKNHSDSCKYRLKTSRRKNILDITDFGRIISYG